MKILKGIGSYLEKRAEFNRNISAPLLLIGAFGLGYSYLSANFSLIYFYSISLIVGWFFFKKYLNYSNGLQAENLVIQHLQSLNDNYFLINDIKLSDSYGNIDHIVLGSNGIFVIETKNFGGQIICDGDKWIRRYEESLKDRDYDLGSPSKQAKRNALKVKEIIYNSRVSNKPLNIWVDGIVVFTKPDVELKLSNTTVPILQIGELTDYIENKKSRIRFSSQELELIGKELLRNAQADCI